MTVRISPQKTSKILHLFFKGMSQPDIAKKLRIDQATVSRYVLKLKEKADSQGIMAAAKEYEVMHEIDALRSLAVELSNNKLTAEEAREGVDILNSFSNLGVSPAEHKALIRVISKLKNRDFVPASMKLAQLEASTGRSYTKIVSEFEQLSLEIAKQEERCAALKKERETLHQTVKELTMAKKSKEQELQQLEKEAKEKQVSLKQEMAENLKEANLTFKRIKDLKSLTMILKELDISDDKLKAYLKEHQELEEMGITWENFKTIVRSMKHET